MSTTCEVTAPLLWWSTFVTVGVETVQHKGHFIWECRFLFSGVGQSEAFSSFCRSSSYQCSWLGGGPPRYCNRQTQDLGVYPCAYLSMPLGLSVDALVDLERSL